jgi:uncharacterized membrane protein YdjX (TVP38/TMEM64 family)
VSRELKKPPAAAGDDPARSSPRSRQLRKHSAHHTLLFGLSRHKAKLWWVAAMIVVVVAAIGLVVRYTDLTLVNVTDWIDTLNPLAVLPLMAILPIAGFPISVVYLVAGAKFGPLWGGVVVAAVTTAHLLGTYVIARSFLRKPLQRFIEQRHTHLPHIPDDEQAAVCLIAALVPGLPYVIRNYVLALADIRLRYYVGICLPIYVARSYVTILLGDMSSDPSRTKIMVLIIVDVLKVAICALVIWRLRVHHRKYHGHDHEDDHGEGPVVRSSAAAK